jgi:membrane-associated protease RseP (regulator of RpoE activity)
MLKPLVGALVVCCVLCSGCADAVTKIEKLNIAATPGPPKKEPVPVYESGGERPPRAMIPFARIIVSGNGYADREFLNGIIAKRAAELGADAALVNPPQTAYAGTVTTSVSAYSAVSQPVYAMGAVGFACVWSPSKIGVQWDDQYRVIDVTPDGPAARAGVRIGDRVLAIGGERVTGDPLAASRAALKMLPGASVAVELVAPDNQTRVVHVVPEANT